jgi:putative Holliday junction resolvase
VTVLSVDHGERRIGVAISDGTDTLARPLAIVKHVSRQSDARKVLELAQMHDASLIVVGQSMDEQGIPNLAGRRAGRFADELSRAGEFRVLLWDESMSTQDARSRRLERGATRKKRAAPVDAEAAAVILQSYLDCKRPSPPVKGE